MAARLAKVFHVRLNLGDGAMNGPHPFAALNRDAATPQVVPDQKADADKPALANPPVPPRAKTSDDSSVLVLRDDPMAGEDRGSEQPGQTDSGLSEWVAKPRKRRSDSAESLSVGTIAAIMAAVIVVGFAFTAILPSILTRPGVDSTVSVVTAPQPVTPPQVEQFGAVQPAPDLAPPAPLPTPVAPAPAPASNAAKSVATPPPALRPTSVPPARQAEAAGVSAGKGPATGRIRLTAAEQAAVTRGLQELENKAAVTPPARPASPGFALTADEQAAVERGLQELAKAPGQVAP
jgi:hypothetical protein